MKLLLIFLSLVIAQSCSAPSQSSDPDTLPDNTANQISDEELLDLVQKQTFEYFWTGSETQSGMARERYHMDEPELDAHLVTTGGSGFGIMAILAGIERSFITRREGFERIRQIADFLEGADRFQGAWPHWLDGITGEVMPFSENDDGGDLVETAFLVQGMLCARQFFKTGNEEEQKLADQLDLLWRGVNWNHFRGPEIENVLFWHWSAKKGWPIKFRLRGYNETLITYILAASSPEYGIPPEVYHEGWAAGGEIVEQDETKPLRLFHQGDEPLGGPLFWAHYSFLGLDPRSLEDRYVNYWDHNVQHVLSNYKHCVENPHKYPGYGPDNWGLTASYSLNFYAAHSPKNDLGVISPTAALSSMPYTPKESMRAVRHFYKDLGSKLFGPFGFYDAFSIQKDWFPQRYLAIDQGPIVVMIENHRSGMLWELFMSCEEVQQGLDLLGFKY